MSQDDTALTDRALTRLRAAQLAADSDPPAVDDDALLAVAHGDLPPEREAAVMRQLATSSSLRAYLREAARPVDAARAAAALAVMTPTGHRTAPTAAVIDPFADPLAPEPPAYTISGPFGRIRAQMDPRAQAGDDVRVFGPDSVLEWRVHAPPGGQPPSVFGLWCRPLDGAYTRAADPTIETSGAAMRLSITAAALFPAAGLWQVALVIGSSQPPSTDGRGPFENVALARLLRTPDRGLDGPPEGLG